MKMHLVHQRGLEGFGALLVDAPCCGLQRFRVHRDGHRGVADVVVGAGALPEDALLVGCGLEAELREFAAICRGCRESAVGRSRGQYRGWDRGRGASLC